MVKFVGEFLGRTDFNRAFSHKEYAKIERALKGVQVETIHHTDRTMKYRIKGLSVVPLKELMFSVDDDGIMTTVVDYYQSRYNCKLEYIHWPCLQCGVSGRQIYLPMEVCKLVQGQRYRQKLSTTQAAKLLKITCKRPQNRLNGILKAARGNFDVEELTEGEFSASGFPKVLYGSVLSAPLLKYGNEEIFMPIGGQWNMANKVFEGKPLAVQQSSNFMDIQSALESLLSYISELFTDEGNCQRLQLLIVVLPEEKGHYGTIKRICETQLGIVSQCCLPKYVKAKVNVEYLENVALKINVKAGGRNAILQEGLPFLSDIPTIIFGADVSHPSPGVYSSSVSAVSILICVISAQQPKQEIITKLFQVTQDSNGCVKTDSMIKELLLNFYQKNRRKPERIIFYRDGVSESQFSPVLLHEVDAIRKACISLDEHYVPPITFLVVQKRHQTRLFPLPTTRKPEPKGIRKPEPKGILPVPPVYYAHLAASRGRSYQGNFGDGSSIRETTPGDELPEFLQVPKIHENVSEVMFYC
ncbi:hypothetical protein CFC21_106985 [Triticum aestivum]|uniref:Piwi domain-containing protein n=2 Tax=Triticum aestivum TaxID=4565 RepID=A0A3B6TCU5_WHEAT|nr:hypothetical protein CFC21_106985 [Triticum aestivum]